MSAQREALRLVHVQNTTGGTEVVIECEQADVAVLVEQGREFAKKAARDNGFPANAITSEDGPLPTTRRGYYLRTPEELQQAQARHDLVQRKKIVLTFAS